MTRPTTGAPGLRVLLVVMPFVSLKRPILAVSLLKSIVQRAGHECDVAYPCFELADTIGVPFYEFVATRTPTQHLVGEWIFAEAAFGADAPEPQGYLDTILTWQGVYSPNVVRTIAASRPRATEFVDRVVTSMDVERYDVIGCSTSFQQNLASIALLTRIKQRHPDVVTMLGGANAEGEMGVALHTSFPELDIVFSGESDVALPEVLERLADGRSVEDVAGIVHRQDGRSVATGPAALVQELDGLPLPDHTDWHRSFVAHATGAHLKPEVTVETSRGCWWGERHQCTFCGLNGGAMHYRSKSSDRAFEELASLRRDYPTAGVFATDNILDLDYFRSLFPRLIEHDVSMDLSYEMKSSLRKSQLALLKRLGTTWFQPGIESLSTPVLRLMDKGTRAINNVQVLKWAREMQLAVTWNIISGFPGESPDAYEEMLRTIRLINHLCPPASFAQFRLDRFSPLFEDRERYGLEPIAAHRAYGFCYPLPTERIMSLAYFFEHSYQMPEDLRVVVHELWLEVERWKAAYPHPSLTATVTPSFVYVDDRRGDVPERHLFAGVERDIYLLADRVQSVASIGAELAHTDGGPVNESAIRRALRRFVAAGLMLREDDAYLSLAVLQRSDQEAPRTTSPGRKIPVSVA